MQKWYKKYLSCKNINFKKDEKKLFFLRLLKKTLDKVFGKRLVRQLPYLVRCACILVGPFMFGSLTSWKYDQYLYLNPNREFVFSQPSRHVLWTFTLDVGTSNQVWYVKKKLRLQRSVIGPCLDVVKRHPSNYIIFLG